MTLPAGAVYRPRMQSPGLHDKALVAFRARPWLWLGGVLAALLGVAVVQGAFVEAPLAPQAVADPVNPPYRNEPDARAAIEQGKARAAASGKHLMVTFGANWCPDCLALYANLRAPETRAYVEEHFETVTIDVGDSAKSAAVQHALGFGVNAIPLAMFYSPSGELIGDTFGGELKPSRHFSAREIRDFLREVVDYRRIVSPDQRQ